MSGFLEKKIAELQPGDVIAKPVYTEDGSVLLSADTVLMARHISLLEQQDVFSVIVESDDDDEPTPRNFVRDSVARPAPPAATRGATAAPQTTDCADNDGGDPLLAAIVAEARARDDLISQELPPSMVE